MGALLPGPSTMPDDGATEADAAGDPDAAGWASVLVAGGPTAAAGPTANPATISSSPATISTRRIRCHPLRCAVRSTRSSDHDGGNAARTERDSRDSLRRGGAGADVRGVRGPPRRRRPVLSLVRHLRRLGRSTPTGRPGGAAACGGRSAATGRPAGCPRRRPCARRPAGSPRPRPPPRRGPGPARRATGPRRRRRGVQAGQEHAGQRAAADAGLPGRCGRRHRRPDARALRRDDRGPRPSRPTRGGAPAGTVGAGRGRLRARPDRAAPRVRGSPDAPSDAAVGPVPARHPRRRRTRLRARRRHPQRPRPRPGARVRDRRRAGAHRAGGRVPDDGARTLPDGRLRRDEDRPAPALAPHRRARPRPPGTGRTAAPGVRGVVLPAAAARPGRRARGGVRLPPAGHLARDGRREAREHPRHPHRRARRAVRRHAAGPARRGGACRRRPAAGGRAGGRPPRRVDPAHRTARRADRDLAAGARRPRRRPGVRRRARPARPDPRRRAAGRGGRRPGRPAGHVAGRRGVAAPRGRHRDGDHLRAHGPGGRGDRRGGRRPVRPRRRSRGLRAGRADGACWTASTSTSRPCRRRPVG